MISRPSNPIPVDTPPTQTQSAPLNASSPDSASTDTTNSASASKLRLILKVIATTDTVNIATLHRRCFELMLVADPSLTMSTNLPTRPIITKPCDFPVNDDYISAFKIVQRRANKITLAFDVHTTFTLNAIKRHSPMLIDHLRHHNMSLQTSLLGADSETTIGVLLGINPEKTSRDNLRKDLQTILHNLDRFKMDPDILHSAKTKKDFLGSIPKFQIETRKITKEHANLTFDTKAFHIICETVYFKLMTHIFEVCNQLGLLVGIGKFLSFKTSVESICKAVKWHNTTITGATAFEITNFPTELMEQHIHKDKATTWRQKLVIDGHLLNLYRAKEENRFIATTHNLEQSLTYFKSHFIPLFRTATGQNWEPTASPFSSQPSKTKSTNHSTCWDFLADDASLLTESTSFTSTQSLRSPPPKHTTVQFIYTADFPTLNSDPTPTANNSKPKSTLPDAKSHSSDTITTITHEDLLSLKDQLRQEFKHEMNLVRQEHNSTVLQHTNHQTNTTARMNELIAANQAHTHRIHELVTAFQTFQTTILRTLGVSIESPMDPSDRPNSPHPVQPVSTTNHPTTTQDGRKRDSVSTPVHKNSPRTDNSPNQSPFLTPSSHSTTSKKRLKGFNANRLYYSDSNPNVNLSNTFDAIMASDNQSPDQPALLQAGQPSE